MATSPVSSSTSTAAEIQAANKAAAQRLLTSLNAGSGVDVAALAQNLVDAERIPKENAINAKITKNESKISGLSAVVFMMNELRTNLAGLKDRSSFNTLSVANSTPTALNVTTNTAASAGSYSMNIHSLAQPQRSMSAGFASKTSMINNGVLFDLVLSSTRPGVSTGTTTNRAPSRATIEAPSFRTPPTTTDFTQFNITVAGNSYSLTPAPATASLSALATNLQTQLRALDSTMSVSVVDGNLVATSSDYTKRISQMSLTMGPLPAPAGASAGSPSINATNTATISGISFGAVPATDDFDGFSLTVNGTSYSLTPAPATADLDGLATDLDTQLKLQNPNLSVSVVSGDLVVSSSDANAKISNLSLNVSATGNAGVSAGTPSIAASTTASITGAAFGTTPATTDFSQFSVTVGANTYAFTPAPVGATLTDLASNLNTQLQALDPTLSVALNGSAIEVTSTAGNISNVSLTVGTAAPSGSSGTPIISPVATYISSLSGVSFGTNPSVTDFKSFSVTVDGKTFNMTPAPETADLNALATNLTSQLQALDGSTDLTVTVSGSNTLEVRAATTTRKVYDPTLSTSTTIKLDTGASAGTPSLAGDSIADIAFGNPPSTNNFKSFSIKIGDNLRTVIPAPTAPTVAALAEDLQKRLRILEGNNDIVVTATGDDIAIRSVSGKPISRAVLSKQTYNDTPESVVEAINQANRGVTAELINDGSSSNPFKIMIRGESGASETFSLTSTVPGALSFTTTAANQATDATLTVNGIDYARKTNSFSDVITGVALELRSTTTSPATIVLSQDTSAIKEKLKGLVVAYNDFNSIISETTDPKSELETYGKTLVGDSTVKMVRQQMRNLLFGQSSTPGTAITSLGDLGFKTDNKGVLSLDEVKLDAALKDKYNDVIKAMTGNQNNLNDRLTQPAGIAADAYRRLTTLVSPTGPLMTKSENATTENEKYSAQLEKIKARMEVLLARYTKQFSLMESLVGGVNAQKTSLKSTFEGMMSMYTNK